MVLLVIAAAMTVLISSLCSLFESILFSTRVGVLEAERAGGRHSRLAARFMDMKSNIAEPTSAILVLNTVANTAGATFCGMYATQVLGSALVPAVSVVLTLAIVFVGEILPKTYGATYWRSLWALHRLAAHRHAERTAARHQGDAGVRGLLHRQPQRPLDHGG